MLTTPTRRSQPGPLPVGHRLAALGPTRVPATFAAAVGLLALYVALSFLNSPRGFLGTDTGGKVATLEVMRDHGNADPDVGYWAAEYDPDAVLHPLYYTSHVGDRYVNLTTLPMPHTGAAAVLAFRLPRRVARARCWARSRRRFAARALARRIGASGWLAFVVVGGASPVLIYALDLWEHALGLGAMAWAVVLALRHPRDAAASAMGPRRRFVVRARRHHANRSAALRRVVCRGLRRAFVAFAAQVAAAAVARRDGARRGRAAADRATACSSGPRNGAISAGRPRDRYCTGFGRELHAAPARSRDDDSRRPRPQRPSLGSVARAVVRRGDRGHAVVRDLRARQSMAPKLAGLTFAIFAVLCTLGWGFVPGLLVASPFAAAGLIALRHRGPARELALIAVVPLPLVWAVQFTGGAGSAVGRPLRVALGFRPHGGGRRRSCRDSADGCRCGPSRSRSR